jgi:hypothetical protein
LLCWYSNFTLVMSITSPFLMPICSCVRKCDALLRIELNWNRLEPAYCEVLQQVLMFCYT